MPPADDTVLVVKATEDTLPAQVTINDDGDEDVKKTERKKKRCRQRESSVAVTAEERRPLKSPGILPRIKQKLKMFEYWRHWSLAVLLMLFIGLAISFHFSHASSSVAPVNNANIQAEGVTAAQMNTELGPPASAGEQSIKRLMTIADQTHTGEDVDACEVWMTCQTPVLQAYLQQLEGLPSCPCHFPVSIHDDKRVWDWRKRRHFLWSNASDAENHLHIYKLGAHMCIRSDIGQVGMFPVSAQHCCYDRDMSLITRGRAAGTPNLISPDWSRTLHNHVDIVPWVSCKGDWTRYNAVRPPNNQLGCRVNPSEEMYQIEYRQAKIY